MTMPHNTGCNRLIQEGRANIICSLTDIDEFCHASHRPQPVVIDGEQTEKPADDVLPESDDTTRIILKAIRKCDAKYGHVSTDGLLAILAETNPEEYPISRIVLELGVLELNGLISTQHGNITIVNANTTQQRN